MKIRDIFSVLLILLFILLFAGLLVTALFVMWWVIVAGPRGNLAMWPL